MLLALVVINIIVHTMSAKWFLVKRQELLLSCVKNLQYVATQDGLDKIENLKNEMEKAKNGKIGGSGLGLPIAKEIVKRHGGYINVDSVVDEGTTFTVCLPYRQEKDKEK